MYDVEPVVQAGAKAAREVMSLPKNIVKGEFPQSLPVLYKLAYHELDVELWNEIYTDKPNFERVRAEAADTIAYLSALVDVCDKQIAADKEKIGDAALDAV